MPDRAEQGLDKEGNRYEQRLEDLHDLALAAERCDEPSVPLAEVEARLLADGLL